MVAGEGAQKVELGKVDVTCVILTRGGFMA